MNPKIVECSELIVVGMSATMEQNEPRKIPKLWQQFMPRKKEIQNTISNELIAIQVYANDFLSNPSAFEIWACTEVENLTEIPNEMQAFRISSGTYAVFQLKGMDIYGLYQQIMTEWLPSSGYNIDNRPHFQVMGEAYKNGSPDSEEDVYVPIKSLEHQE